MAATTKGAVVVTGASTGIGEACALHLDKLGFQVFAGVRREMDAQTLKQKSSFRLNPIFLDVTDANSIASAARTVADAVGDAGLFGLVNNAGIAVAGSLEFLPTDEFRKQIEVNVIGQLAVTQSFIMLLRQAQGRIVNIGSIGGRSAAPFLGAYNASKFAMEALTDVLRMELRPWGISISIIEPGAIATPIWKKSLTEMDRIRQNLPQQAHKLYGNAINAVGNRAATMAQNGISADRVAEAVIHALTAKKPKTRYLVGQDARIRAVLNLLPDRVRDRLILNSMGLLTHE
ncbi:short-chain dehydrogenase/reductase [Nostocales cyanobacterium HT-58-2]|nr:short-chain dehydrogenase/reductase [Nostocales cyanobacterium HT-58-2]